MPCCTGGRSDTEEQGEGEGRKRRQKADKDGEHKDSVTPARVMTRKSITYGMQAPKTLDKTSAMRGPDPLVRTRLF